MKSHSRKVNTTAVKPLPAQYQALYKQELNDILKKTAEVLPILNSKIIKLKPKLQSQLIL